MIPTLLWLALAATPVDSFDDGAIVGRVCEDTDGDGRCSAGEPGVAGARVVLETGLTGRTDAEGRFHLAAVSARAPDPVDQRLLPGRHRLKVDQRFLPAGTKVLPDGATVELPMGALVQVDFAVRSPGRGAAPVQADPSPAPLRAGAEISTEVRLKVPADLTVRVAGAPAVRDGESVRAVVRLEPGATTIPISAASAEGRVWLLQQRFEVVRRAISTLVIPHPLEPLGTIELPVERSAGLRVELPPGSTLSVNGAPAPLVEGKGVVAIAGDRVRLLIGVPGVSWTEELELPTLPGVFAVGLLDVEATFDIAHLGFRVFGRGAGTVRARLGGFDLGAELDLRDSDLAALRTGGAVSLLTARRLDVFERQLDPMRVPSAWADDSATVASNASDGRFRVSISKEGLGQLGYGSYRAQWSDTEVGRFHRALQGGFLEVRSPADQPFGIEARAFGAPTSGDAVTGYSREAAHDRLEATGGSVYQLSRSDVVQGSEQVRVELVDAVTGLPLRESHLLRGRDYSLDALAGRILLARPLSFYAGPGVLGTEALTSSTTAVLVVDYEALGIGAAQATFGGELKGRLGPVDLGGGYLRDGSYSLLRGYARATLGPVWLGAEFARSTGSAGALLWSRDGGYDWLRRGAAAPDAAGLALTVRARGQGLGGKGFFDAAWRWRQSGFEDTRAAGALNQVSVRAEQPIGPLVIAALGDYRDGDDPRRPFEARPYRARLIGGAVGYEGEKLGVRLEVRDAQLSTDPDGLGLTEGGRLSAGLTAKYRVLPWLTLRAGYRQRVWQRGSGEGAWDDTFASLGADVKVGEGPEVGLRAGWGPRLGPQVWGTGSWTRGEETFYAAHSLDVDSPAAGDRRFVLGARREVGPGSAVFVEDISSQDVDGLRLARAVGLSQRLADALSLTVRYERGQRASVDLAPEGTRDSGGVGLSWESPRVRLGVRGEGRLDTPASGLGLMTQWLASGGGEVRLLPQLTGAGRFQLIHTTRDGVLLSRVIEGLASLAWRFEIGTVIARYSYRQELGPTLVGEQRQHLISVLPAFRIGDRFGLAAGAHASLTQDGWLLSASLRPSVRVIGGLELAVEVAARSASPDGGGLASLRGEVGYRFDGRFLVAVGFNAFGFSGTGTESGAAVRRDRVYLRAEVGY